MIAQENRYVYHLELKPLWSIERVGEGCQVLTTNCSFPFPFQLYPAWHSICCIFDASYADRTQWIHMYGAAEM